MLLPDWKWIVTRSWSVWSFYAVILLSAAEVVLTANGEALSRKMPVGTYPLAVGLVSAFGIYFRTLAQRKAEDIAEDGK